MKECSYKEKHNSKLHPDNHLHDCKLKELINICYKGTYENTFCCIALIGVDEIIMDASVNKCPLEEYRKKLEEQKEKEVEEILKRCDCQSKQCDM